MPKSVTVLAVGAAHAMFSSIGSFGSVAFRAPQVCYAPEDGSGGGAAPSAPAAPAAPVQSAAPAAAPAAESPADGTLLGGDQPATPDKPKEGEAPPAEGEKPKDGQEKPTVKPEDYGDFTMPEGFAMDGDGMTQFKAFAAEKGWSKEMAQGVLEFAPQYEAVRAQQLMSAYQAQGEAWVQTVRADPEIGGADLGAKVAIADRAVAKFGTPELRALLNPYHPETNPTGTGLGNHPEIVRAFYRAGLTVTEPGPVNTSAPSPEAMSTADYYAKEVFKS